MRKIFSLIIAGISLPALAQTPVATSRPTVTPAAVPAAYTTSTINYVRTREPNMPTADTAVVNAAARTTAEVKWKTQYFDGLGRPLQTVSRGSSAAGNDVVAPIVYDAYGREQISYLPYTQQGSGTFKTDPFNSQATFYKNSSLNPGAAGESIFYSRIEYEASPLNRALKSYAAGNSWAREGGSHPIETQYQINTEADSVRVWSMEANTVVPVKSTSWYATGTLSKNLTIDEVGNKVIEFKDMAGQVILKKVQLAATPGTAHVGWLCTYYVYDDIGNLRCVISPKGVEAIKGKWSLTNNVVKELCYIYRYDERNRMIVKKIPGADSTEMVFDVRDRLVFSRDGNQKSNGQWLVMFYDGFNHAIMKALYSAANSRSDLQDLMNTATANTATLTYTFPGDADLVVANYDGRNLYQASNTITFQPGFESTANTEFLAEITGTANKGTEVLTVVNPLPNIPQSALTPLEYMYYDNYTYAGKLDYVSADISKPQAGNNPYAETLPSTPTTNTGGLLTGTKVKVIETGQWLTTSNYYDDKGKLIQTITENVAGGKDIITSLYDFTGKVLSTYLNHTNLRSGATPATKVLTMNLYDNGGRLLSIRKRLNDNASLETTIAEYSYDELGRLKKRRLGVTGTSTQLDNMEYEYHLRGWMQGINKVYVNTGASTSNWFGQELNYDYGFSASQYNGNIAGNKWKSGGDGIARAYGYTYDPLSRLTGAEFNQQNTNGAAWSKDKIDFSVSELAYDENGNIATMTQKGMNGTKIQPIDQLTYTYRDTSNKLLAVTDPAVTATLKLGDFVNANAGLDYQYDTIGNLTQDLNKRIASIHYNYLNLPDTIQVTNKGTITYQYDAAGNRIRKGITDISVTPAVTRFTDYIGPFVYDNDTLQFCSHEEGRIRPVYKEGQAITYGLDYFEKDHLGNVRIVLGTKTDTSVYAATMESAAAAKENALFSNIDNTRTQKPAGYPADATTSPNDYLALLNANNGKKIGPSIVLRVMAGDTLQLGAKAFYKTTAASTSASTSSAMLTAILQAFSGTGVVDGVHGATGSGSPIVTNFTSTNYDQLKQKDASQNLSDKPKAYLNYVLFDDGFTLVDDNSGMKQVQGSPDVLQTLGTSRMVIKKTGFMYIYTSNESGEDVYFDNLTIVHNGGPLLEETHYYPFGLTMAGISSNALKGLDYPENRMKYNGKELQNKEFGDGSGLDWYNYGARMLDPQLGRWMRLDPLADSMRRWSPYSYSYNNPIRFSDPDGMKPDDIVFRGLDNKEIRILTAGEDKVINVPVPLITNRSLDLGLQSVNPNNFAYGYTSNVDVGYAVGGGVNYGLELSVVNFTDNRYSDYNYVYAGGHRGGSVGGQISFGGNAGISLFVAYDTHKETDPASFADKSYAVSVSADIKAIVGGGLSVSGFSSTKNPGHEGWKGLSIGVNVGVGGAANYLSIGLQKSTTTLLNNVKPTSERGWLDRLTNAISPVQSSILQYGYNNISRL